MQVLEDLRKTWHKKERISIKRNERHIQKCTAQSGRQDHRGHEHVWYETWNTTLTRVVLCLNSVNVAPQTRVSRMIKKSDGGFRIRSRIPDFGIIRQAEYVRKIESGVEVIKKRLQSDQEEVSIVEIKRAPENSSADRVRRALGEAYGDLCFQVDVFFAGHPDVNAIIGIFVAGSYWNYKVFTRDPDDTSTDDDGEDDESYRPSSERGSSSQAREESVGSWSEESDGSSESSPDELDIIDKSEDPSRQDLEAEVTSEGDEESIGLDVVYILQTEVGELGLTSLMEATENLEGCEEFDDPL
ncbi:hypothetical protein A7U60_g526 [Sanghuangporus baumii]|uniref:Uncharacterized protein n=1 Tax=Sanghuangporus baumii TaxID=108892 RepID=A0A9Q5NA47_SANBA|nr:hypothetical protein A7U60_g526 [Sanghuangporus baumii]